jgi:hypothetical protein
MHLRLFHEYNNGSLHIDSDKLNIKTRCTNNNNRSTIKIFQLITKINDHVFMILDLIQ